MINTSYTNDSFPAERQSYCQKIIDCPVIGPIIKAIIQLFKKIFPRCFSNPQIYVKPINAKKISTPKLIPQTLSITIPPTPKIKIAPIATLPKPPVSSWKIEYLLKLPKEVLQIILQELDYRDLLTLQTSLKSIKGINPIISLVEKTLEKNNKYYEDILRKRITGLNNGTSIKDRDDITAQDKVWILRLYELHNLDPKLVPQITLLHMKHKDETIWNPFLSKYIHHLFDHSPDLLKQKKEIEETLASTRVLSCQWLKISKFTDAIYLLKNLEEISIQGSRIIPPELGKFSKLKILNFGGTILLSPLILKDSLMLEVPKLSSTQLTSVDVTHNPNLKELFLDDCPLQKPPDISHNPLLTSLYLIRTQLITPPDTSHNLNLRDMHLNGNQLTELPNVSQNLQLQRLALRNNPLSENGKKELGQLISKRPSINAFYDCSYRIGHPDYSGSISIN